MKHITRALNTFEKRKEEEESDIPLQQPEQDHMRELQVFLLQPHLQHLHYFFPFWSFLLSSKQCLNQPQTNSVKLTPYLT